MNSIQNTKNTQTPTGQNNNGKLSLSSNTTIRSRDRRRFLCRIKVRVANQLIAQSRSKLTASQRTSDACAKLLRSWRFVIAQLLFIGIWIALNGFHITHFDPAPFDILKLILIIESSFMGSMLLMSQNRQSNIDRKIAFQDYAINWGSKKELDQILGILKAEHSQPPHNDKPKE